VISAIVISAIVISAIVISAIVISAIVISAIVIDRTATTCTFAHVRGGGVSAANVSRRFWL
jgi:hypothetical protein